MVPERESRLRQLEDAIEAWLGKDPALPAEQFLAEHAPLRDLLQPMLAGLPEDADADADAGTGPDPGPLVEDAVPTRLGDFELRRELGRGGMGVVYEAEDRRLKRSVAIKLLRRSPATTPSSIVRFWREAELAATLHHPGVVPVHSLQETGELFYLVMRLERGASLSAVLGELAGQDPTRLDGLSLGAAIAAAVAAQFPGIGAMPRSCASHAVAVAELAAQVAEALGHAHGRGIVHRDVKPGNILVDASGRTVLTDFGLACVQDQPGVSGTGEAPGTPNYMAPEQVHGRRGGVSAAIDVFALGATVYELLTLQRAFPGDTTASVLFAIVHREPVAPTALNPLLPRDLVAIVYKALEKDPRRRYPDGAAMARDLRAFLAGEPVTAESPTARRRLWRWIAREPWRASAALLLLLAVPAAALAWQAMASQQSRAELGERLLQREWLDAELAHGFREAGEGDSALARAHFEAILLAVPDAEEAIAGLSVDARRHGDLAALAELTTRPAALARSVALQRRQALLLHGLGRAAEAAPIEAALPQPAGFDAFLDGYGHLELGHRGLAVEHALAARKLRRAVVTSDRPRPLFYYEWLHAAAHAGDDASIDEAMAAIERLWPQQAGGFYWIGFAEHERGRPEAALRALEHCQRLEPGFQGAIANRARLLRSVGRNDEALAVLRAAMSQVAQPQFLYRELGPCLALAGQIPEALRCYEQAIAAYPHDDELRRQHAAALIEARQVPQAVALLQELLQRRPGDPETHLVLATAELARRRPAVALQHVTASMAIRPSAQGAYLLGLLRAQDGDAAGAQQAYEQALALDRRDVRSAVNLAILLLRGGEAARAEATLRSALDVAPTFVPARRALLRVLDDRPRDAVAMCRDWLVHSPDLPEVGRHLAWAIVRTGEAADAAEALRLARAADAVTGGRDAPTLHVLGAALLATGAVDEAEATLHRALTAIAPDDPFGDHYRQLIDRTLAECRLGREGAGR